MIVLITCGTQSNNEGETQRTRQREVQGLYIGPSIHLPQTDSSQSVSGRGLARGGWSTHSPSHGCDRTDREAHGGCRRTRRVPWTNDTVWLHLSLPPPPPSPLIAVCLRVAPSFPSPRGRYSLSLCLPLASRRPSLRFGISLGHGARASVSGPHVDVTCRAGGAEKTGLGIGQCKEMRSDGWGERD